MLDVSLLGTGGMMPLPKRYLTSCLMRYQGESILIDCGEGTQIALRKQGWSCKPIGNIFLTHFHADHIAGLPGLLLTMGNAERKEPVTIIGPKGVGNILRAVRTIAPELPFETRCREIEGTEDHFSVGGMDVTAFKVNHRVPCYSYEVKISRGGKFDVARAKENNIPLKAWNPLQKGQIVEMDGKTYTPDMVLGPERKGIKVVYSTDTRPTDSIRAHAKDADLLILEGMYGEEDRDAKAKEYRHMTMTEAARIAAEANPKEMWYTHYSPLLLHPEEYREKMQAIFPRIVMSRDGQTTEIPFEED